jgi:hypothetical protein
MYESRVTILRNDAVRVDDAGRPRIVDVDIDWRECPGEQLENVRGDAAFAACVGKFASGSVVPVRVEHRWAEREEHYTWHVSEIGGCPRAYDAEDKGSFTLVQECVDVKEHGEVVGFRCDRVPKADLVAKCPWFRVR